MKKCTKCKEEKTPSDFKIEKQSKSGRLKSWCIPCDKKYHKEYSEKYFKKNSASYRARSKKWEKEHPAKIRAMALKYKYGITPERYAEMFKEQNGGCAICSRQNLNGKRLGVDHDHATGKVRGLLCRPCNYFLGCIDDSHDVAKMMVSYLEKHEDRSLV